MPNVEIKTDVEKNYFEGVNLTFIVWELNSSDLPSVKLNCSLQCHKFGMS
jgi:hypothetical protein